MAGLPFPECLPKSTPCKGQGELGENELGLCAKVGRQTTAMFVRCRMDAGCIFARCQVPGLPHKHFRSTTKGSFMREPY